MFQFGTASIRHMEGIHPSLKTLANEALRITKIDFGISSTGGLRSIEEQEKLFKEGKSKADGYTKKSKHQLGKALDFYAYVNDKASYEELHLAQVGAAFLQAGLNLGIKIRWGGLFKSFSDMPHIELVE